MNELALRFKSNSTKEIRNISNQLEKEKVNKLKAVLNNLSSKNENLIEENQKLNKQIISLVNALRNKDKQIEYNFKIGKFLEGKGLFKRLRNRLLTGILGQSKMKMKILLCFLIWYSKSKKSFSLLKIEMKNHFEIMKTLKNTNISSTKNEFFLINGIKKLITLQYGVEKFTLIASKDQVFKKYLSLSLTFVLTLKKLKRRYFHLFCFILHNEISKIKNNLTCMIICRSKLQNIMNQRKLEFLLKISLLSESFKQTQLSRIKNILKKFIDLKRKNFLSLVFNNMKVSSRIKNSSIVSMLIMINKFSNINLRRKIIFFKKFYKFFNIIKFDYSKNQIEVFQYKFFSKLKISTDENNLAFIPLIQKQAKKQSIQSPREIFSEGLAFPKNENLITKKSLIEKNHMLIMEKNNFFFNSSHKKRNWTEITIVCSLNPVTYYRLSKKNNDICELDKFYINSKYDKKKGSFLNLLESSNNLCFLRNTPLKYYENVLEIKFNLLRITRINHHSNNISLQIISEYNNGKIISGLTSMNFFLKIKDFCVVIKNIEILRKRKFFTNLYMKTNVNNNVYSENEFDLKFIFLSKVFSNCKNKLKSKIFNRLKTEGIYKYVERSLELTRSIIISTKLKTIIMNIEKSDRKILLCKFLIFNKNLRNSRNTMIFNFKSISFGMKILVNIGKKINSFTFKNLKQLINTYNNKINNIDFNREIKILRMCFKKQERIFDENLKKSCLTLWRFKTTEMINCDLINNLQEFEENIPNQINEVQNNYQNKLNSFKNEFENQLNRKDNQIKEFHYEIQRLQGVIEDKTNAFEKLRELADSNRNNFMSIDENIKSIVEEKQDLIIQNKDLKSKINTLETIKLENDTLREKINEYDRSFKNFEKKKEETSSKSFKDLEKKYKELIRQFNILKETKEEQLGEFEEKRENFKRNLNQATDELIKVNNELNKYKIENKDLKVYNERILDEIENLKSQITQKDRTIKQFKLTEETVNHEYMIQIEKIEAKIKSDKENYMAKLKNYEKMNQTLVEEVENLNKKNKQLSEKLGLINDFNNLKKENHLIKEKYATLESEVTTLRIHNSNLQKSNEKLLDKLNEEIKINEELKLENSQKQSLWKDSQEQLNKAIEQMTNYSAVFESLEEKIKNLEEAKIKAENERDKSKTDVNEIRQRYINIMGSKSNF